MERFAQQEYGCCVGGLYSQVWLLGQSQSFLSARLALHHMGSEALAGGGQLKHGTPGASDADPVEGR